MKNHAESVTGEPILVDRAANYFGTEGAGFRLRSSIHGSGVLTLTEDRLIFDQYITRTHVEIPLNRISRLGVGLWHQLKTKGTPILKVTYDRNLVFGVVVAHPERWIEAMESLANQRGVAPVIEQRNVPLKVLRRFRVVLAAVLALLLLLSILLPLLLTWVHRRSVREVRMDQTSLLGNDLPSRSHLSRTGTLG